MALLLNSSFAAKVNKMYILYGPKAEVGGECQKSGSVVLIFSLFLSPDTKCEFLRTGLGSVCLIP